MPPCQSTAYGRRMHDDFTWMDAIGKAELVRNGDVSAVELVDAAIARIEKLNPDLNAVIHRQFDKARRLADAGAPAGGDGPFRGVPFLLKDILCHEAGEPYHCGMRILKEANHTE